MSIISVLCYLISRRHLFEGSQALTASFYKHSIKMKMNVELWWNDTERTKLKHRLKNLSQCQFVDYTAHGLSLD